MTTKAPGISPPATAGEHKKTASGRSLQSTPDGVARSLSLADLTPTQSRSGSPASSASRHSKLSPAGSGSASSPIPQSDHSSVRTQEGSTIHDSLLFSSLDAAHSLTPKYRSIPLGSAQIEGPISPASDSPPGGMPSPHSGSGQQQQQRAGPSRRHQPPQIRPPYGHGQSFSQPPPQHQQPQQYYATPPAVSTPEHGYLSRNQSSLSSGSGQGFAAGTPQRPPSFVGPYSTSTALYGPPQPQYTYSQSGLQLPGMPPPPHSHSAPPMAFGMNMATSHPTPTMYTPSYAPSSSIRPGHPQHQSAQDHTPSPPSGFDVGSPQPGPGPPPNAPAAGATYTQSPQQPFPMYNYGHPHMTTTPQFQPFRSSPFQQHAQQSSPYATASYSYMTAPSPTTDEGTSATPISPMTWWYVQSPSSGPGPSSSNVPSSSATTPYSGVYYVDAYGNPASLPLAPSYAGPGPGLSSLSVSRPPMGMGVQHDPSLGLGIGMGAGSTIAFPPGPGSGPGTGPASRSGSSIAGSASARDPPPPSPLALGASASERAPSAASARGGMSDGMRRGPGNAIVQRSEWVMWVGNVPSDATHDELWRFFTAPNLLGQSGHGPGVQRTVAATSQHHGPSVPQQHQPPLLLPSGLLSPAGSSSASSARFSTNSAAPSIASGVQSIFLIARSNCAFVNYATSAHLSAAVSAFNGMQLRPGDPRCPRLVCRVRGKDEDQRAGVGGQRNMGMHTRWVKQQRDQERDRERAGGRMVDGNREGEGHTTGESEAESASGGAKRGRRPPHHSSSSGSTTSGFLQTYFPKRYFILKSLTQYDLDLSVKRGLWATQVHNETILNQAFRTSKDVYLIFGVNKSGEFFGYARMAGPIGKAEEKVSWASRSDSAHSHSPSASLSSSLANRSQIHDSIPEENESPSPDHGERAPTSLPERQDREKNTSKPSVMLFSPAHQAQESPQPVTTREEKTLEKAETSGIDANASSGEANTAPPASRRKYAPWAYTPPVEPGTAPAIMEHPAKDPKSSSEPLLVKHTAATMDPHIQIHHPSIPLNPEAPKQAIRSRQLRGQDSPPRASGSGEYIDNDNIKRRDMHDSSSGATKLANKPELRKEGSSASQAGLPPPFRAGYNDPTPTPEQEQNDDSQWGTPFKIQWVKVGRLPFHRTRHLRNPWNHEREVKVSRDGTELEPGVGQALLDEWDKDETALTPLHPPQVPSPPTGAGSGSTEREASLGSKRGGSVPAHMRRRTQPTNPMSPIRDREPGNVHSASAPAPPRSPLPPRGRGR